jgi:hypothetical protein
MYVYWFCFAQNVIHFQNIFLCEINEIKETIFIFLKSCLVGLDFHLPFGASSCCLQSLAISDQVLKT